MYRAGVLAGTQTRRGVGSSLPNRWGRRLDRATTRPLRISRLVLCEGGPDAVAGLIVQTYEDQGISGAKGRDQRPAFDTMLKDAVRRRFDVLMVWSIDRLGRSVLHVANALAEFDAAGVRSIPTSRPSTAQRRWDEP